MAFSESTPNYHLPQWQPDDRPTYLIDQNEAYGTLDTALFVNNTKSENAIAISEDAHNIATASKNGLIETDKQVAINVQGIKDINVNIDIIESDIVGINTKITTFETETDASFLAVNNKLNDITADTGASLTAEQYDNLVVNEDGFLRVITVTP